MQRVFNPTIGMGYPLLMRYDLKLNLPRQQTLNSPRWIQENLMPPVPFRLVGILTLWAIFSQSEPALAETPAELREKLVVLYKAKDWSAAETVARQIVAQKDASNKDWRNLIGVLRQSGKNQEALSERLKLVNRPGAESDDFNGLCWAYLAQNQVRLALPYCEKAVALKKSNWAALVNLGHSHLLLGNKAQAQPFYQQALGFIRKDEELNNGPFADFDLFIKNGWMVADSQSSKQWFAQNWPKAKALQDTLQQTKPGEDPAQAAAHLPRLAQALQDSDALLGKESSLGKMLASNYLNNAKTMATAQVAAGKTDARQTLDKAWAVVKTQLTPSAYWDARDALAQAHRKRGEPGQAIALREDILREQTSAMGLEQLEPRYTAERLVEDYLSSGQGAKAAALGEKIVAACTTKLDANHPAILLSIDNLAYTYGELGQPDKALALNEKALAARTAKLGADHPDTLSSMAILAVTYGKLSQHDKALSLKEKVLATRTAKLGADHPDTLTSMNNLAVTYSALGQHDKALTLKEKVLAARTAKLGADHPDTLTSMSNLAVTYLKLGQHDKALAPLEKVLAVRTAKQGADHPDTLDSMGNLALGYYDGKQFAKAATLREKLVPKEVKNKGEKDSGVQTMMISWYVCLERLGRKTEFLNAYSADTQQRVKRMATLLLKP